QEVCPWNRRAAPRREAALGPRPGLDPPHLPELLSLDREAFAARFRRHAGKRPKRRGLLRNAAVALGNSGDPAAVPALVQALQDEEPLVRGHAAWALGQLGGEAARRALERAAAAEGDGEVREEIARARGRATPGAPRAPGNDPGSVPACPPPASGEPLVRRPDR
ncbi:MAG: HEAT repeat domain-containing protein, partial [Gemmatimonadota bacterium]